jgi:REP-associated tyrosine transposase
MSREPIVIESYDRNWLMTILADVVARSRWRLYAYCLMGNHFHLVVRTELELLSAGMKLLKGRYAHLFNQRHRRSGHLFEARYASIPIRREQHAIQVMAYVALNPVAAGLCPRAADWLWSSHRATAGLIDRPAFLADLTELGVFGDESRSAKATYCKAVADGERALADRYRRTHVRGQA